jgi:transcriptional regulator with XRE-family HTH domain
MQESLPQRLRLLRARNGWDLREAARRAGVGRDTLSNVERGRQVPHMATLSRLAKVYGVPTEELSELLVAESEVSLAGAGKASAPSQAGQPEREGPDPELSSSEEEPTIVPQSVGTLKTSVDAVKRLKGHQESQLERIRQKQLDYRAVFVMELANKGLRTVLNERGILQFAEAVVAHRELAEHGAEPLCHELLRELRYLEDLTAEARAVSAMVTSDIHEEVEKDAWQWLSGAGPLVSDNAVSSSADGAG